MTLAAYEVPMTPVAQSFQIALGGTVFGLTVFWCSPAACWVMNIADSNGAPIVNGIAIVTGVDLLQPYAYLDFNGSLIVFTDGDADAVPTFDNFGIASHLYFCVVTA